jgi:hypothetical protein
MLPRKAVLASSVFLLLALCVWATDPWKNSDFEKWSSKDVDKILNSSPWAKSITVPFYPYLNGDGRETDDRIRIGSAKDPSSVAESALYQPAGTFILRWNSALTLRRALYREAILHGTPVDDARVYLVNDEESMELTLIPTGQTLLPPTEAPTLRQETYLQLQPSGHMLRATLAETRFRLDARGDRGYIFYFPQRLADGSPSIPKNVTEIVFFTQVGVRRFEAKFRPAEMVTTDAADYF